MERDPLRVLSETTCHVFGWTPKSPAGFYEDLADTPRVLNERVRCFLQGEPSQYYQDP